jgi:hypothetical protein
MLENSYRFGWIIPETLRDDKGLEEFWHLNITVHVLQQCLTKCH